MYRFSGELDPEAGHALFSAIDAEVAARVAGSGDRSVDWNHLAAKALVSLVTGGHQQVRPAKAQLTVVIDYDRLRGELGAAGVCELGDGTPIPAGMARRLACEAGQATSARMIGERAGVPRNGCARVALPQWRGRSVPRPSGSGGWGWLEPECVH